MQSFISSSLRISLIGVMLLVAAAANLICISYDANDQDDIPPVSVDLKFVQESPRAVVDQVRTSSMGTPELNPAPVVKPQQPLLAESRVRSLPELSSPEVLAPLLC